MSLTEIIQADAITLMEDLGEDATYIPAGTADEDGYTTRAYVSTAADRPTGPEISRVGTGRQAQKAAKLMVMLPRLREDEAINPGEAVGADGGIQVLSERDAIIVPGRCIGQPAVETVRLIVTGGIDSPTRSGHWWAEVAL